MECQVWQAGYRTVEERRGVQGQTLGINMGDTPWEDGVTQAELSEILQLQDELSSEEKEAKRVAKSETITILMKKSFSPAPRCNHRWSGHSLRIVVCHLLKNYPGLDLKSSLILYAKKYTNL